MFYQSKLKQEATRRFGNKIGWEVEYKTNIGGKISGSGIIIGTTMDDRAGRIILKKGQKKWEVPLGLLAESRCGVQSLSYGVEVSSTSKKYFHLLPEFEGYQISFKPSTGMRKNPIKGISDNGQSVTLDFSKYSKDIIFDRELLGRPDDFLCSVRINGAGTFKLMFGNWTVMAYPGFIDGCQIKEIRNPAFTALSDNTRQRSYTPNLN